MASSSRVITILALVSSACAVAMTAVVVQERLFTPPTMIERSLQPVAVANWSSLTSVGNRIGNPDAPVTVLVFTDFECPYCARFANRVVPAVKALFRDDISILIRHWPLANHRFARSAAIAAECAGRQHRFEEMHNLLFATQDSLGLIPYPVLAARSGVKDIDGYIVCLTASDVAAAVDLDIVAARSAGGRGTPIVFVNGLRLLTGADSAPSVDAIRQALAAVGG